MNLGPVAEPILVLLGTVTSCGLLHHLVIRHSRILRPLFELKAAQKPSKPAAATAPAQS
ncbi:MAG: hypothetical protein IPK97_08165 [Ahniella sp.]|nr:hypothetical protein [Ahniella sp.]